MPIRHIPLSMPVAALVLALQLSLPVQAQPVPVAAAASAELPSVALPPALDAVLRDYERAFRSRDAQSLSESFAEDGFALPEGRPPMRGRATLREAFRRVGGPLSLRPLAFKEDGDLAVVIGAYRFNDEGTGSDDGKFVLTLVREAGGAWRIFSDMDSGNAPPRRPAQARP